MGFMKGKVAVLIMLVATIVMVVLALYLLKVYS